MNCFRHYVVGAKNELFYSLMGALRKGEEAAGCFTTILH